MKTEGAVRQGALSNPFSAFALSERLKVAASLIPKNAKRILDVGCGEGYFEKTIAGQLHPQLLEGIDPSPENVAFAKKLVPGATFRKGTAELLPFPDSAFDCVACFEVLDHLQNPARALSEMHRVLSSAGVLVLSVANTSNPVWNAVWFLWTRTPLGNRWHDCHAHEFSTAKLRRLLAKSGFEIISEKGALFNWVITVSAKKASFPKHKAHERKQK